MGELDQLGYTGHATETPQNGSLMAKPGEGLGTDRLLADHRGSAIGRKYSDHTGQLAVVEDLLVAPR